MQDAWKPKDLRWDLRLTARGGPEVIARKQAARIRAIVAFARTHSSYYAELYEGVPWDAPLTALPPVKKRDLMDHFDDWVTDPDVTREAVDAFVADPTLAGRPFLGRYSLSETSGSIEVPGIILQDAVANELYSALAQRTRALSWRQNVKDLMGFLRHGFRSAGVISTGSHQGSSAAYARVRRRYPWLANRMRTFSIMTPLSDLIEQLNSFQPTHLITYPSMALILAHAQAAGNLHIHPIHFYTGAETLEPAVRTEIEHAFGVRIIDIFNATEFPNMAHPCPYDWLHLNADWAVLEPVDRDYRAVPPGQPSYNALLTNLANRVQPFIRYEMGDSVTVRPDPCRCGSPFPAIRVLGRASEVLTFTGQEQRRIDLSWVFFYTIFIDDKRVTRWQVLQVAPATLRVRLEIKPGSDVEDVWAGVWRALQAALQGQGLPELRLERASETPENDPASGKYRRVWRAFG